MCYAKSGSAVWRVSEREMGWAERVFMDVSSGVFLQNQAPSD
jgi:hypothetical protein